MNVPLTFSALLFDGTLLSGTKILTDKTSQITFAEHRNIQLNRYTNGAFMFWVASGFEGDVVAVKLELGPIQTLAHQDASGSWVLNDPPPNKALELAKCQRYQFRVDSKSATYQIFGVGRALSSTDGSIAVPLPVSMRLANPTLVADASKLYINNTARVKSIILSNISNSIAKLNFTVEGGISPGESVFLSGGNNADVNVLIDANL